MNLSGADLTALLSVDVLQQLGHLQPSKRQRKSLTMPSISRGGHGTAQRQARFQSPWFSKYSREATAPTRWGKRSQSRSPSCMLHSQGDVQPPETWPLIGPAIQRRWYRIKEDSKRKGLAFTPCSSGFQVPTTVTVTALKPRWQAPPPPHCLRPGRALQGRFFGLFDPSGIVRRPGATRAAGRLTTAVALANVCAPMPASSRCASLAQRATDAPFFKCTRQQIKKEAAIFEAQARRCTMPQSRPRDAPRAALRPLLRKRRILQVLQSPREKDGAKSGAKKRPEKKRYLGLFRKVNIFVYMTRRRPVADTASGVGPNYVSDLCPPTLSKHLF
jgi:hypothetical protein